MNIIDIQDQLKNFSEQQLISEMQMPTGSAPQFLVLSEIKRRKRVRDDFMKREAANQPTVAQEAVAAAGVPKSGIMGMSEAMAPHAAVAEGGIGSIMPQSMRPQTMPAPTDDAIPMAEGGVIKANIGMFFRPDGTPTEEGIAALIGQESGGNPMARGSKDELGLTQIRPGTAIMPGYGVQSMFPEISSLIGPGKKYDTNKMSVADAVQKAYEDNKELVDSGLIDPERSTSFSRDYLTAMSKEFPGDPNRALAAYNVGPDAAANLEDPSGFDYVKKVLSRVADAAKSVGSKVAEAAIPSASAANLSEIQDLDPDYNINEISEFEEAQSSVGQRKTPAEIARERLQRLGEITEEKEKGNQTIGADQPSGELTDTSVAIESDGLFGITSPQDDERINLAQRMIAGEDDSFAVEALSQRDFSPPVVTDIQTPTDSETGTGATSKSDEPNITFSTQPSEATSSLQQEILDLQEKMKKDRDTDKYLALAQAGLALMSSKDPTLLGAIGEAGVSGLQAYREAQDRYNEGVVDLINARAKLAKGGADAFDAGNAVTRLGQIERALGGADGMTLSDEERTRLLQERLFLQRFIGIPELTTGASPAAPAS
jgi:hypothetical protein